MLGLQSSLGSAPGPCRRAPPRFLYIGGFVELSMMKECLHLWPSLRLGPWPLYGSFHSISVHCRTYSLVSDLWGRHTQASCPHMAPFSPFLYFAGTEDFVPDLWLLKACYGIWSWHAKLHLTGVRALLGLSRGRSLAAFSPFLDIVGCAGFTLINAHSSLCPFNVRFIFIIVHGSRIGRLVVDEGTLCRGHAM